MTAKKRKEIDPFNATFYSPVFEERKLTAKEKKFFNEVWEMLGWNGCQKKRKR